MSQERERTVPPGTRFVVRPGSVTRGESACWRVREMADGGRSPIWWFDDSLARAVRRCDELNAEARRA